MKYNPESNSFIQKGQLGMQAPKLIKRPQGYGISAPAFKVSKSISINPKWSPAPLPEAKITTTNEMFDSDIKMLSKWKDKIPEYAKKFKDSGYTPEQTAGILGSLFQESNFDPTKKQVGGKGFGFAQWTIGDVRYNELQDTAKIMGKPITDPEVQFKHLLTELNAPTVQHIENAWGGRGRREQFLNTASVKESTKAFTDLFLRAGKADMPRRLKFSNYIYNLIK